MWRRGEFDTVEVTAEATDEFYRSVDAAIGPTVWNTGCNSWYFTDQGSIDLFPFDRAEMVRMLAAPDPADFELTTVAGEQSDAAAATAAD